MTQHPGSSEPTQDPTAPTYGQYPGNPAQPGAPTPPPTYTSGPPPQTPNKIRRFGRLGGLAAVVLVVGGKIALTLGLGSALGFAHDKVEHRVPDAEAIVKTALQAGTIPDYLASGTTVQNVTDEACLSFFSDKSWTQFEITRSTTEDDGSADVKVEPTGKSTDIIFHMVDQSGWKIERFTCDS